MSELDRCLAVIEDLECKLRLAERANGVYAKEIVELTLIKNLQIGEIKTLKKDVRTLQIVLERGIS